MAIEKEKFFEIICNVSESKDLNEDNLLQKIKDELCKKDYAEYDKFKRNFSKEHQFSIKISDKIEDWTLLHLAAACNNLLTVELLLKKKASVKTRVKDGSNDGPTALDIATSNGNQEIIQLLRKANPQLEKNKDKTSRDIIIKTNKTPEGLVVNGNNAAAESANVISPYLKQHNATRNDKQTSVTGESSDNTVDEQHPSVNVKDMVKKIESPKKTNATYSDKRIRTGGSDGDDSGLEFETTSNTSSHSEMHNATETPEEAEKVEKLRVKLKKSRAQLKNEQEEDKSLKQKMQVLESENATLKGELEKTQKELEELRNCVTGHETRLEALKKLNEENLSLKQKIQNLESENATLNSELEENENKHSKTKVLLERTQKELEESKSCIAGHETKLKQFNKENESLRQEIKSLENENTTLKGTTKTKTDEVSLEKVGKRQMCFLKVASVNLVTMLAVGAIFSIAFQLPVLLTIATFVVSALIASGVTYAISTKPDTELKEVDIGSAQRGVCKT